MPGYFGRLESLHRIHSCRRMWIKKSCASLFFVLFLCFVLFWCFTARILFVLWLAGFFPWKTGILIRPGESCMLSRGHSAKKPSSGRWRGKAQQTAQAFVYHNLERKWLCSSWKRFVWVVARRLTNWDLGFGFVLIVLLFRTFEIWICKLAFCWFTLLQVMNVAVCTILCEVRISGLQMSIFKCHSSMM